MGERRINMNLKEFLKDKELNQITIEGQVYFKLRQRQNPYGVGL